MAMSRRWTSTRLAVTLAIAYSAAISAMMPNSPSSRPSSRSLPAIDASTCWEVATCSTGDASVVVW